MSNIDWLELKQPSCFEPCSWIWILEALKYWDLGVDTWSWCGVIWHTSASRQERLSPGNGTLRVRDRTSWPAECCHLLIRDHQEAHWWRSSREIERYESHYENLSGFSRWHSYWHQMAGTSWHAQGLHLRLNGQSQKCDHCLEEFTIQVVSVW